MEQLSEVDRARTEALGGNVETALPVLARHAEAGDDGAAASAAELSAYLWRWDEVIGQAARLIANPYAVYAGNVFHELVLLLGRAGHQTGDWRAIARVADAASERVEADLRANPWGFPKTKIEGERYLQPEAAVTKARSLRRRHEIEVESKLLAGASIYLCLRAPSRR